MDQDSEAPLGVVPLGGRSLAFELLHGEALYLHALRAMAQVGVAELVVAVASDDAGRVRADVDRAGLVVRVLPGDEWWDLVRGSVPCGLLVHDPLCPLASTDFLSSIHRHAAEQPDASRAAFRPVTDTVKTAVDGRIQGTIDREGLAALTSPVLISAAVIHAAVVAGDRPPLADFAGLLVWVRARGPVDLVPAPALARRVDDASAVHLLECVDELGRQVRTGGMPPGPGGPVSGARGSRTP